MPDRAPGAPSAPSAGARGTPSVTAPPWLTRALGPELTHIARAPWGFTNETWAATTSTGERFAVTRMGARAAAAFVIAAGPTIAGRVADAGLEMPAPIAERSSGADGIVVSRWLDGSPAMQLLVDAAGARTVGAALGDAWTRLRAVAIDGLALESRWASPGGVAAAAAGWLAQVDSALDRATVEGSRRAIAVAATLPSPAQPSFVHGDLVPANLLLRDGPAVLLDLESARIGDPLLDAAWFRWIVGYHHPELLPAAWEAFSTAAGLSVDAGAGAAIEAYPVLRILEILATEEPPRDARPRWHEQLARAAGAYARAAALAAD